MCIRDRYSSGKIPPGSTRTALRISPPITYGQVLSHDGYPSPITIRLTHRRQPSTMVAEWVWFLVLGLWAGVIVFAIKPFHAYLIRQGCEDMVAVYYNRKVAHMLAGGVPIIFCPIVFTNPIWPLLGGLGGAAVLYATHLTDRRLWWMQTEQNMNDATFALMLGVSVFAIWEYSNEPWLAILPSLYMAFGDGVTGIARKIKFGYRTKNPIGNVFMAIVCIPMGYYLGALSDPALPIWGIIAAIVATVVERYEFGPIDDNVLITVSATIVLFIGDAIGPLS